MQKDGGQSRNSPYLFARVTSEALDTLSVQTRGPPAKPQKRSHSSGSEEVWGLTRSLFRPSDDAVTMPYNIPGTLRVLFRVGLTLIVVSRLTCVEDCVGVVVSRLFESI